MALLAIRSLDCNFGNWIFKIAQSETRSLNGMDGN